MTLKTGTTESGFSMIELMITVSFVALGSLLIQGSFLRSADMFGRYSNTLRIADWMNGESAKARQAMLSDDLEGSAGGTVVLSGRSFSWSREVQPLSLPDLSALRYEARWTEGGKPMQLKNELYVYKKDASFGS